MKGRLLFVGLLIAAYMLGILNVVFSNTYLLYATVVIFAVMGFFSDKLIKFFHDNTNGQRKKTK